MQNSTRGTLWVSMAGLFRGLDINQALEKSLLCFCFRIINYCFLANLLKKAHSETKTPLTTRYILGAIELLLSVFSPNAEHLMKAMRIYGTILLAAMATLVFVGVKYVLEDGGFPKCRMVKPCVSFFLLQCSP